LPSLTAQQLSCTFHSAVLACAGCPAGALKAVEAHSKEVNGIDFNPHNPHLLATCSSDTTVGLWDWRCLDQPLHVLEAHTDGVYQVSMPLQHGQQQSAGCNILLHVWTQLHTVLPAGRT
jgi:WD40 repeat protein